MPTLEPTRCRPCTRVKLQTLHHACESRSWGVESQVSGAAEREELEREEPEGAEPEQGKHATPTAR